MCTCERDNQCTEEKPVDRGWNAQWRAGANKDGVVHPQVSDMGNRTVCLSASLTGSGDMK